MAHSSAGSLPDFSGFSQSKTLYLPAPKKGAPAKGILLTPHGVSYRESVKQFADAHAALTWCERHEVALIFWHVPNPAAN